MTEARFAVHKLIKKRTRRAPSTMASRGRLSSATSQPPGREESERAVSTAIDPGARVPQLRAATDEAHLKEAVERDLHLTFPSVPLDQVATLVECLWAHFDGARVRDFVPLLVGKQAKEELLEHFGPHAEP